jgi:hypothetical protein
MTFTKIKPKLAISIIASVMILGVIMPSMLIDDAFAKKDDKVTICHIPPGNPDNPQTIQVAENAVEAHLAHGDTLGECGVSQEVTYLEERSHAVVIRDRTDDNDCVDGDVLSVSTTGFLFHHVYVKIQTSGTNDCDVGLREWNISSIPDNAQILSVEWIATFHQAPGNIYPTVPCDIIQVDTRPSTATDPQLFMDEINSNPAFVEDDAFCTSGGSKIIDLGPSAASHMENVSLDNDWFAFAIKARPDAPQLGPHQSIYTDEESSPTSLRVVYLTTS